jgi:2-polyprenyl-6-methoxyphenol hydroxylase-like FAD-dependent oxidoreductase
MSPVGGVGINYAIQDAVETANLLGPKLQTGGVAVSDLAGVQRRRALPTSVIQRLQGMLQRLIFSQGIEEAERPFTLPLIARWVLRVPALNAAPARLLAFGIRPAHVRTALLPSPSERTTDAWRGTRV